VFFKDHSASETSKTVQSRVIKARNIQKFRYETENDMQNLPKINARISGKMLEKYAGIDDESQKILKKSVEQMSTSMRGITRILRVARTIADLENSNQIKQIHLLEAIGYRRKL